MGELPRHASATGSRRCRSARCTRCSGSPRSSRGSFRPFRPISSWRSAAFSPRGAGRACRSTAACIVAGSVGGAMVVYAIVRRFGARWLHARLRKAGIDNVEKRLEAMYSHYGMTALFVSRFLPVFRAVAPPMAGAHARSADAHGGGIRARVVHLVRRDRLDRVPRRRRLARDAGGGAAFRAPRGRRRASSRPRCSRSS